MSYNNTIENEAIYLKYSTLKDMLKVIVYSSQSALALTPMLYHITYNNREILFVQTSTSGSFVIHYIVQQTRPVKKYIELKRLTGEFVFVDRTGSDSVSLYIPILEIEESCLKFPF
jgi:hypothetical protein